MLMDLIKISDNKVNVFAACIFSARGLRVLGICDLRFAICDLLFAACGL